MNILFVNRRFHTNQIVFAKYLISQGHDVSYDVIQFGQSEDHSILTPRLMMESERRSRSLSDIVAYVRRLQALRPDVVVVRGIPRHFALTAAIAARFVRCPMILVTQRPVHAPRSRRRDLMRAGLLYACDAPMYSPVVGNVRHPRTHPNFHYLPFAADCSDEPKTSWFAGDAVHILAIGKFVSRKNHVMLVRAFHALQRRFDVKLTIIGEVSTPRHEQHFQEVEAEIVTLGMESAVVLRTNLSHAEVKRAYRQHDLFVLPSRFESASVSILEGMSFGLPVICSSTNGTKWYIEPGRNGYVFESDDIGDFTAKMESAISDRANLVRMGAHSRRLAETVHAPMTIYHAFMDIVAHTCRVVDA